MKFSPLILLFVSLVASLIGIWNIKRKDFDDKQTIVLKSILSIASFATLFFSIIKYDEEGKNAINYSNDLHRKDSIYIDLLKSSNKDVNYVRKKSDSIFSNEIALSKNTFKNFDIIVRKHQYFIDQFERLSKPIPKNILINFECVFEKEEIDEFWNMNWYSVDTSSAYFNILSEEYIDSADFLYTFIVMNFLEHGSINLGFDDKDKKQLIQYSASFDCRNLKKIEKNSDPTAYLSKKPYYFLRFNKKGIHVVFANLKMSIIKRVDEMASIIDMNGKEAYAEAIFGTGSLVRNVNVYYTYRQNIIDHIHLFGGNSNCASYHNDDGNWGEFAIPKFKWSQSQCSFFQTEIE